MLTLIDTVSETVKQSLINFAEGRCKGNTDCLSGPLVTEVTAALDRSLREAGRAGIKAFIEGFECAEEQVGRGGHTFRLRDCASRKKFLTIFGEVELERRYYHCPTAPEGARGIVALDERWSMAGRYATPEVVENVLWMSALLVPGEVAEACSRLCRFTPSTSCIQDIIRRDGTAMADMLEADEQQRCRGLEVPAGTEVFVASLDGANVLLREPGVKKGRPSERPGTAGQPAGEGGASPSSYKNAMVGSFSFYRRTDGSADDQDELERIVPERISSFYCARMPEEKAAGFKAECESILGVINGRLDREGQDVTRIALIDGARPLWRYIAESPAFEGFNLMLDFYHGSDHLSLAAEALFGKGSEKGSRWFEKWRSKLKYEQGGAGGVLRSIARYRKTMKLPRGRREDLDRQVVFFENNKAHMNYHEHVVNGWPIGSGPVEAACKTIVKERMCQSGMRWSRPGGRSILALRVLIKSRHWDNAWEHYHSERWGHPEPCWREAA